MKRHLLLFLLPLLVLCAKADPVEIDGIYYTLYEKGKTAEVTNNPHTYKGSVSIPEKVTYNNVDYSVTSIGERAFENCSGLTSVVIPDSVTSIGEAAFANCSSLTSVNIPNSVTSIESGAFISCSGLTSITIPNSVTSIGLQAFYGCSGLTSVYISDLEKWCNIKFDHWANPLMNAHHLYLGKKEIKDLVIPNSVTSIGDGTFEGCSGLTSVTIHNGVTSIGESAFDGCSGLTTVTIPNSVTSIGIFAFFGCSGLTSVTIGNSVTYIGEGAFRRCSGLTSINIPNSVTYIGEGAFISCSGLTTVTIPNSVTSIGEKAFANCTNLADVYCYAENVPFTDNNVFYHSDIEYTFLHVPAGSIDAYKAKSPWNQFMNIVAIDATVIESIESVAAEPFDVYDMSGRKVLTQVTSLDGLPNGVYIINGKKMIIK